MKDHHLKQLSGLRSQIQKMIDECNQLALELRENGDKAESNQVQKCSQHLDEGDTCIYFMLEQ